MLFIPIEAGFFYFSLLPRSGGGDTLDVHTYDAFYVDTNVTLMQGKISYTSWASHILVVILVLRLTDSPLLCDKACAIRLC